MAPKAARKIKISNKFLKKQTRKTLFYPGSQSACPPVYIRFTVTNLYQQDAVKFKQKEKKKRKKRKKNRALMDYSNFKITFLPRRHFSKGNSPSANLQTASYLISHFYQKFKAKATGKIFERKKFPSSFNNTKS